MTNENGFQMVDNALSLAVSQLVDKGLPQDEAYIALLLRLKYLVPNEIQQVADLLSDDDELMRINPDLTQIGIFQPKYENCLSQTHRLVDRALYLDCSWPDLLRCLLVS